MAMDAALALLGDLGIPPAEAEPFFEQHHNQTIVIKLGGNIFTGGDKKKENDFIKTFARDIVLLKKIGINPIIVHGGGPAIDKKLQQANIAVQFVKGLRYTDTATMNIVASAMADINYELCRAVESAGGAPLPHPDNLVLAEKLTTPDRGDLGWVGRPVTIAGNAADELLSTATIPILSPIGYDRAGNKYNINGDNFAGFIATALQAERFLLMTNIAGLLDKNNKLISQITAAQARALITDGTISGGMIPKIETAIATVRQADQAGTNIVTNTGAKAVAIIDGRAPHAVWRELFAASGNGTLITR